MRRYFKIIQLEDDNVVYIYEKETRKPFYLLKAEMMKRYHEGYLRRRTDGPYFLRMCMNNDFRAVNSNIRVC